MRIHESNETDKLTNPGMVVGKYLFWNFGKAMHHLVDGTEIPWNLSREDLTRADWRVVPDEVIAVGDIVKRESKHGDCQGECEILKKVDTHVRVGHLTHLCACWKTVQELTLIRKGPEVIVFEGVEISYRGNGWAIPMLPCLEKLKGNTYTITFKKKV